MTRRNLRLLLAVVAGVAIAGIQAAREFARLRVVIADAPRLAAQLRADFLVAWALLLLVSGAASFVAVYLCSRAARSKLAPLFPVAIVVLLFVAMIPLFWYRYSQVPGASHVSIPASERYTPALAAIAALVMYGLAGLVIRNNEQHDPNAA